MHGTTFGTTEFLPGVNVVTFCRQCSEDTTFCCGHYLLAKGVKDKPNVLEHGFDTKEK
jgi:hypothetical protein